MKKLKILFSGIIALATVATNAGFTISAYDICDINQDGKVTVRDVAAMSRYLSAESTTSDYSILDVNKDLIVDYMDQKYILAKVMGQSYSSSYYSRKDKTTSTAPSVSNIILNNDAKSMESREYRRYSYISQKELSTYKLTPSTKQLTSSNISESRIIIGDDDRYESKGIENTGIVNIYMAQDGEGTGFVVGDHQIATAAHNVFNKKTNNWCMTPWITLYKYNGELSDIDLTPVEVHIPAQYEPNVSKKNYKYDYALITVKEDLSDYVHFNLGEAYSVNESNYSNIPIYVTGSPKSTPSGDNNSTARLYTGEGRVISKYANMTTTLDNTDVLNYNTDMQQGCSGGPVYTVTTNNINGQQSYAFTVIAINDFETPPDDGLVQGMGNGGTLITKYLLQFYKNNTYANY